MLLLNLVEYYQDSENLINLEGLQGLLTSKAGLIVAPLIKEYALALANSGILVNTNRELDYCTQSGHNINEFLKSIH